MKSEKPPIILIINRLFGGLIIILMTSQLVYGQDEMFTLIRKIPVDDLGVTGQIDACEFSKDNYYIIATDNHATAKVYIRETGEFVNQVKHIDIKNTGVHTINVVMQRDGVEMDKIVLTLDAEYDPSKVNGGTGPTGNKRKIIQ